MKKSKKFVLAALVLLAITGLLALAGCKNDSVSEAHPSTAARRIALIRVTIFPQKSHPEARQTAGLRYNV